MSRSDAGVSEPPAAPLVRAAATRDLDQVAALWTLLVEHHAVYDSAFELRADASGEIRRLIGAIARDPDATLLVRENDDGPGLVGFCAVRVDRAPPIQVEVVRAEITDLVVLPGWRRRGIGRELVEAAQSWVRGLGVDRCEVRVAAHNVEGQAFWRALGFGDLMDVLHRRL